MTGSCWIEHCVKFANVNRASSTWWKLNFNKIDTKHIPFKFPCDDSVVVVFVRFFLHLAHSQSRITNQNALLCFYIDVLFFSYSSYSVCALSSHSVGIGVATATWWKAHIRTYLRKYILINASDMRIAF